MAIGHLRNVRADGFVGRFIAAAERAGCIVRQNQHGLWVITTPDRKTLILNLTEFEKVWSFIREYGLLDILD